MYGYSLGLAKVVSTEYSIKEVLHQISTKVSIKCRKLVCQINLAYRILAYGLVYVIFYYNYYVARQK